MAGFSDVRLEWQGEALTIPARKMLQTICDIEEIVSMGELAAAMRSGGIKMGRLAKAYGVALRAAGAKPTDDEVYMAIQGSGTGIEPAMAAVTGLLALLIPPSAYEDAAKEKAPRSPKKRPAAA